MSFNHKMKAPKGTSSAFIDGHSYDVPKSGIIKVAVAEHIETLKRHGFEDHFEKPTTAQIEDMNEEQLVEFLEEHGEDADGLSKKKLRNKALTFASDAD